MKVTTSRAGRAVRMYMPMQAAVGSPSSIEASRFVSETATEAPTSNEARTARRLTEGIMRSRALHRQAQRQHEAGLSPIPPPLHAKEAFRARLMEAPAGDETVTAAADTATSGRDAMRLALSYGRSALLTHLAHQHDDSSAQQAHAYSAEDWARMMGEGASATFAAPPTVASGFQPHRSAQRFLHIEDGLSGLLQEVERVWAKLDKDMKLRWVLSTPQGRRALRQATETTAEASGGRTPSNTVDTGRRVPSIDQMLSKYTDALVRPRLPRPAALSPAPKARHLHKLFFEESSEKERAREEPFCAEMGEVQMHSSAAQNSPNRISLRRKADAARAMEREGVWLHGLASCLGGDNAVKFVNDVKSLQRPPEENNEYEARASAGNDSAGASGIASPTSPAEASADVSSQQGSSEPIYSTGLLDLCEKLGIRSPRRVYVRSRVLQAVDEAAATAQPLNLDQVRELATNYCTLYDKEVEAVAATAEASGSVSPAKAVLDFEKYQLELAVDRVHVKLSKFQADVPLLRNCTSVFDK
ncbi:hypothetical protein ABL78_2476 [Leptomonas seymouri]|uniref:Uncharacterized protein n=1 Tax=Leptomonas seymouri TaxID=5684 RepID=A0A0N1ILK1_LEPSE|nr:hypothetical protein ABL78_2476 [Leptomonas seymouri]|eukprot:KPI88411.1 hypothetical protein ABL78_2476 [Leptomonas seymouri]